MEERSTRHSVLAATDQFRFSNEVWIDGFEPVQLNLWMSLNDPRRSALSKAGGLPICDTRLRDLVSDAERAAVRWAAKSLRSRQIGQRVDFVRLLTKLREARVELACCSAAEVETLSAYIHDLDPYLGGVVRELFKTKQTAFDAVIPTVLGGSSVKGGSDVADFFEELIESWIRVVGYVRLGKNNGSALAFYTVLGEQISCRQPYLTASMRGEEFSGDAMTTEADVSELTLNWAKALKRAVSRRDRGARRARDRQGG